MIFFYKRLQIVSFLSKFYQNLYYYAKLTGIADISLYYGIFEYYANFLFVMILYDKKLLFAYTIFGD